MAVQGRKKADLLEEVRNLQERFEHLSVATGEGVFLHEAGRILDLNESGAALFGYRREELIGRSVIDLSTRRGSHPGASQERGGVSRQTVHRGGAGTESS